MRLCGVKRCPAEEEEYTLKGADIEPACLSLSDTARHSERDLVKVARYRIAVTVLGGGTWGQVDEVNH